MATVIAMPLKWPRPISADFTILGPGEMIHRTAKGLAIPAQEQRPRKQPEKVAMPKGDTDNEWEKFGKDEPYFGVLTNDKFRKSNLTEENREEFFKSGFVYIEDVLENIRRHLSSPFTIKKCLDFGCGVGRLVIPLAGIAQEVTGVDVSDSMLDEARKNCGLIRIMRTWA